MNLNKHLPPTALGLALMMSLALQAANSPRDFTQETTVQRDKRMAWFNEARFGMFIHWGVYAVPAGEWNGKTNYGEWFMEETKMPVSQYEKFAAQFHPVKFDARAWARLAKNAGMKYLVITSKHHDGFGLWDSALTDWDIGRTPLGRDPLKELADACKKEGIRLCFYHSIMDWHHPDWGTRRAWHDTATGEPDMDRYVEYMKGQLKELITRYGPLGILWFDGEWESAWTHERGVDLYNYVRSLQPDIIINNRVGKGRAGMQGMDKGQGVGDYGTPEQEIPATGFGPGVAWESCMTMNRHWGYNQHDQNWKSTQMLVRNLIDCASKGGNYLLNIGPTAEGLFPAPSVERLAEIGQWMKVNGDSIYGTQASPFKKLPWGRCTQKPSRRTTTLYLHVFEWPKDGQLLVPGLQNQINKAWLLADKKRKALPVVQGESGPVISVPAFAPDALSSTVIVQIKGAPHVVQSGLAQNPDGSITLPPGEAQLHGSGIRHETGEGRDNLGYWTNPADWAEWEIKVAVPGRFEVSTESAALQPAFLTVGVGGQTLRLQIPATGSYSDFKPVKFGTLDLPVGEKITLNVRPVREGWNPVNLKAIKLQPVR